VQGTTPQTAVTMDPSSSIAPIVWRSMDRYDINLHVATGSTFWLKGRDQLRWGACGCAICARQRGHFRNRQENNEISKRRRDPTRGRSAFPGSDTGSVVSSFPATRHTASCRAVEPRGRDTVTCPQCPALGLSPSRPGSTIAYHKVRVYI